MDQSAVQIIIPAAAAVLSALVTFLFMKMRQALKISGLTAQVEILKNEKNADLEKIQWLEKADEKMREAFESLSARALRQNADQFLNQSKEQIDNLHKLMKGDWNTQKEEMKGIVGPIEKELDKLDRQVRTLEEKRQGAYMTLETHLKNLSLEQKVLQEATTTLSQALRSSTVRGKWGEVQLRRIAEMAGMVQHVDFDEQKQSDAGMGRPDMIIRLPEKGIIPVDAKAPMESYLNSVEAKTDEDRKSFLIQHAKSMRATVKSLSQKLYWEQFKESQPQYVVMLVPYESGLSAAFIEDPELMDYALANRVIIVSPATLLALLKVIALGWMQLQISRNAQEIAAQGKELYARFVTFSEHFQDIGTKLQGANKSFNSAVGSMERRVMPAVKKLKELGAGTEEIEPLKEIE